MISPLLQYAISKYHQRIGGDHYFPLIIVNTCIHIGYKFYLGIYENGRGEGQGTHVSVELVPSKGPFDDSLCWPAKCTMTLQLLNQHRDQDHITMTRELEWKQPSEEGEEGEEVTFSDKFIAHGDLKWNAEKHTQYLKDEYLHFRIV